MPHSIVIKNALIVNEGAIKKFDLITRGRYVLPSMIDGQMHFREPGLSHNATIAIEFHATRYDAWYLPKEAPMERSLEYHSQWHDTLKIGQDFEWKWYYAFQQVGDQNVETHSRELRSGVAHREQAMHFVSRLSTSLLAGQLLSKAPQTNLASFQKYNHCVIDFHQHLRELHYPMLFGDISYSNEKMAQLLNNE